MQTVGNVELGRRRKPASFSDGRSVPSTQKESTFHAELLRRGSPLEDGRGGEGSVTLWVQRRGGRARAWPERYIIREQRTSVPYNQNSAADEAKAIFLSADVMDRWTDAGGRGTDGLTHDETEERKTEEVKKLSGEIGATKEQNIFIQMHAPPLPSRQAGRFSFPFQELV